MSDTKHGTGEQVLERQKDQLKEPTPSYASDPAWSPLIQ